jgi:lysophospholipase L1-like esterase
MKQRVAVAAIIFAFVAGGAAEHFRPRHDPAAQWQRGYIAARTELLRQPSQHADLVMLGDSLTEYEPGWPVLLGTDAANMGIAGDTTDDALARLDAVIARRPKVVAVMLGINDVLAGRSAEKVAADIEQISDKLAAAGIVPIVQSTLLTAPSHRTPKANVEIRALDSTLASWCLSHKVAFLDLNRALSGGDGLRESETWDGLHLNSDGYRIWGSALRPIISEATGHVAAR